MPFLFDLFLSVIPISISAVFTHPGENIDEAPGAVRATDEYIALLDQIHARGLDSEISVKLTQLGLDLSSAKCYVNLKRIIQHASPNDTVWIDTEASRMWISRSSYTGARARRSLMSASACRHISTGLPTTLRR
jgi:hypothetical protein